MVAQFEHNTETFLTGNEFDFGERELDLALSLEHSVDFFVSALAFTKTRLSDVFNDEGNYNESIFACGVANSHLDVEIESENLDLGATLMEPLQKLLEQSRSVRGFARKLAKRVETLIDESSALKHLFMPRLAHLTGLIDLGLEFSVALAQQVPVYIQEIKERKEPFKVSRILACVRASAGKAKAGGGTGSFESVGELLAQLAAEAAQVLNSAAELDSVIKSKSSESTRNLGSPGLISHWKIPVAPTGG